jgi:hypothetical protein
MDTAIGPRLETTLLVYLAACRRLRTERDADGLLNLLIGVADPGIRLHRFAEHLRSRSVHEAAWTLAYLQEQMVRGDGRARRVGFGLLDRGRLLRVLPPEQVHAVATQLRKRGHASAALLADEPRGADATDATSVPRPKEPVGYRISLARRAPAGVLERLLLDPDPRVVRTLLGNPRLTEAEVVTLAASRRVTPEALEAVVQDDRWIARYRVKVALANNPGTPARIVLGLLPYLMRQDLQDLALSTARPEVRQQATAFVAQRSGLPEGNTPGRGPADV